MARLLEDQGSGKPKTNPSPDTNDKRKALTADRTTSSPTIRTDYGVVSAPDYYQNLRIIEAHSNSKLPTDVTLYLAGLPGGKKQLVRTAQVFAKRFDPSPKYIFGSTDPKDFTNPVTGEPLSLKDAQRITDGFAQVPLAGMINAAVQQRIADMTKGGSNNYKGGGSREASQGGEASIKQKKIQEWARALSTHGGDMPLEQGIGLAVWLASQPNLSVGKFKHNVELAQQWWAMNSTRSTPIDPQVVLSIAIDATRDGKTLKNIDAVTDQVFGAGSAINQDFAKFLSTSTQVLAVPEHITLEDLPKLGPDYWNDVNSLATQVALDQEAFSHSAFGKFLGGVGFVGSKMWYATERGLVELGFAIETPVATLISPLLGKDPGKVLHYMQDLRSEEITRLNAGEDIGNWVEEGYSNVTEKYAGFRLPSWTSTAFDFAVGWYVDPTVIFGKAGRVIRGEEAITGIGKGYSFATRIMPGLESPTVGRSIIESIPGIGRVAAHDRQISTDILQAGFQKYITNLPDSRVAGKIFDAIYTGADNTALLRSLDLYTPGRNLTRTLDYEYMKLLRSKLLEVFPKGGAAAREAFNDALRAHFAQAAPADSIAEWVVKARETRAAGQVLKAGETGIIPDSNELAITLSNHLASGGDNAIPFTLEGPSRFGAYGPRSLYRRAVTSQGFTGTTGSAFSDTKAAFGKRTAQVFNVNPGRVLNVHQADDYFVLHMRRWGAFDENAVRKVQSQIFEAKSRGYFEFRNPVTNTVKRYGYEDGLDVLMNKVNSDAIDYIVRDMNVDPEVLTRLKKSLLDPINQENAKMRAFMVLPGADGETVIRSPLLETQRVNFRYVVDPVQIRREIREYTTLPRRLQNHLAKAFDSEALKVAIGGPVDRNLFDRFLVKSGKDIETIWNARKRFWKSLTVARPGYIPRVILLDENARFLFTTRSVSERLASQEWFGLMRKLEDKGIGTRSLEFGDETKKIPLPGAYERNPAATGNIRQSEQIEEMLKRGQQGLQRYAPNGSFGPIYATGKEANVEAHLVAWKWALEKQMRGSAAGRVGLEAMAETGSLADVRAALVKWAQDDHFVVLTKRIGVKPDDFENWYDEMSQAVFAYTGGSKKLAQDSLVLSGRELETALNAVPPINRPTVHGPGLEALTQGGGYAYGNGFTNWMYDTWVRRPEAALNRFPYYKAMKRRAELSYYDFLKYKGVTNLTPEVRNAIDVASTNFGLERVRSVMFDLTRQSRFTELLQIVFPFPQPFFEGFQTWGAIAMRHPETVGRTMQLFRTGVDSGFIRKDEASGEYVVPLGIYRKAAVVLNALGIGPSPQRIHDLGIGMVAPLSSFNLIASSTIKFGADGFIGKMIGGVPIPAPGADPLIALLGQKLLADRNSVPVASYLFQYGPSTPLSLIPTPVKSMLTALGFEGLIPTSQKASLTYSILRTYQVEGLDRNPDGSVIPLDELQKMAEKDASDLLELKAMIQLFSPAAPRLKTAASPYEAEWQDLIENSPDYNTAIDEWIARHPTLSYVTIGKTFFDAGIKGPNGEELHAPRLPASAVVDALMKQKDIGPWMQANPAWAGLVLIGLDPKIVEAQDFGVYSKQLSEGLMKYRPIDDFLARGENVKVMKVLDDWYTSVWDPARANITDTSSPAYRDLIVKRTEELAMLAQQYPNWATTHLVNKGEDIWEFPMGGDRPYDLAVAQARRIAATPGFQNAPGFQALGKYLDIRDGIAAKMDKLGVTDIMLPGDDAEKLRKQFGNEIAKLEADTPGIEAFVSAYFGIRVTDTGQLEFSGDLRSLPNTYIKKIEKLPDDIRDAVVRTATNYQQMRSDADRNYNYTWQKSQNYQTAQSFFDQKVINQPEVMKAWWNSYMTPKERAAYQADLATKPTIFYNAWDWHLQGVKVSEKQVGRLEQIAEWRIGIQKSVTEDPHYDQGAAYTFVDGKVAEWSKKDPKFKAIADNISSWTFGLRAAGFGSHPNHDKVNEYWNNILNAADGIQANVDDYNAAQSLVSHEMHGTGGFDKDIVASYRVQQDWLLSWVKFYSGESKAFKESWYDLQESNGDALVGDIILPNTYYRLGG